MKIAFFELEDWEESIIREHFPQDELFLSKDKLTSQTLSSERDFEVISVFVDSEPGREVLDNFPKLKYLATRSTGYDHIDLDYARERGIAVAYVPGYGDNTVAEFAFGLILSLSRKIYQAIDQIKEIESFSLKGLRGRDLKGKTIGIIGTGRIGKEMIKIASGFSMRVIAYDLYPDEEFAAKSGCQYLSLEELLGQSDIISIHAPLTESTKHLINQHNISLIKHGALLVNTARGAIVETNALVAALKDGILAGAGLDVLEEEGETKDELNFLSRTRPKEEEMLTMLQNHILMKMPNVLVTPHNAFNSQEALERILQTTIENIKSFRDGKPINLVK